MEINKEHTYHDNCPYWAETLCTGENICNVKECSNSKAYTKASMEIKPCPFCGGEALPKIGPSGSVHIKCINACIVQCGTKGEYIRTIEQAVEAWNRRAGDGD